MSAASSQDSRAIPCSPKSVNTLSDVPRKLLHKAETFWTAYGMAHDELRMV